MLGWMLLAQDIPALVKSAARVTHFVGLALGAGAATTIDLLIVRFCVLSAIREEHVAFVAFASRIVAGGLVLLWASGLIFLVQYSDIEPAKLANPKIWAKLAIVLALTINGAIIHTIILPLMRERVGRPLFEDLGSARRVLMLVVGMVSATSWYVPLFLGAIPQLNFVVPAGTILLIYVLLIGLGVALTEAALRAAAAAGFISLGSRPVEPSDAIRPVTAAGPRRAALNSAGLIGGIVAVLWWWQGIAPYAPAQDAPGATASFRRVEPRIEQEPPAAGGEQAAVPSLVPPHDEAPKAAPAPSPIAAAPEQPAAAAPKEPDIGFMVLRVGVPSRLAVSSGVAGPNPKGPPVRALSNGDDALAVQRRLSDLGFLAGPKSGVWGARSAEALRAYKVAQGLGHDGTWNRETELSLFQTKQAATQSFVGSWAASPAACTTAGRSTAPVMTISAQAAAAAGLSCAFREQRLTEGVWTIAAACARGGAPIAASLTLAVRGDHLVWSDGRGRSIWRRCPAA